MSVFEECGRSGTFRKGCRQQDFFNSFYKCLLCIGIDMLGLQGGDGVELDLCEHFFIIIRFSPLWCCDLM